MKPWLMLSTQVARTQPEVVSPVSTSVSTPAEVKDAARLVPKKELGYCLVMINSSSRGISPSAKACVGSPATKQDSGGALRKNTPPSAPPLRYLTSVSTTGKPLACAIARSRSADSSAVLHPSPPNSG